MKACMLPDGKRLHLNHGPIDLIIEANDTRACNAAIKRFETVLDELVSELTILRTEIPEHGLNLKGRIARRMERAVQPHWRDRVTPMAAVAGSVAEEILDAMLNAVPLNRCYVNNGGDIALHLGDGEIFTVASPSGKITITADDNVRGIATSGWRGRSFSLGIADSVTVLARTASQADVAATLIANAVDLPGSPKVKRQPANEIAPDSDLGERLVTVGVEMLREDEALAALDAGVLTTHSLVLGSHILSANLRLMGQLKSDSSPACRRVAEPGEAERFCVQGPSPSSPLAMPPPPQVGSLHNGVKEEQTRHLIPIWTSSVHCLIPFRTLYANFPQVGEELHWWRTHV